MTKKLLIASAAVLGLSFGISTAAIADSDALANPGQTISDNWQADAVKPFEANPLSGLIGAVAIFPVMTVTDLVTGKDTTNVAGDGNMAGSDDICYSDYWDHGNTNRADLVIGPAGAVCSFFRAGLHHSTN